MRQLILQPFRRFTYVTVHSPTLPSLLLRLRLFTYVTWRAAQYKILSNLRTDCSTAIMLYGIDEHLPSLCEMLTPTYNILIFTRTYKCADFPNVELLLLTV